MMTAVFFFRPRQSNMHPRFVSKVWEKKKKKSNNQKQKKKKKKQFYFCRLIK